MAILTHRCPHPDCLTDHVGMIVRSVSKVRKSEDDLWAVNMTCPACDFPTGAIVRPKEKKAKRSLNDAQREPGDVQDSGWVVAQFWPVPPSLNVPEFIHPDVARIYSQAERSFLIVGNEEVAGMAYRKALDIGLKKIDPALTGMLGARIKALTDADKLPPAIADWSNAIVRVLGNDAAHEEAPISRDDLSTLRSFTEMVLRYLFTLPNMIKKRRGERLDWETDPDASGG